MKSIHTPILEIDQFDELASSHDVYVNRFSEHVKKHHAHILRPHKHAFFLTVLFTSGTGFHEIDFVRYPIEAGAVFLLQPGQSHHWEFSADTEGWIFFHSESFWNYHYPNWSLQELTFFQSGRMKSYLSPENEQNTSLEPCFSELLVEYQSQLPYRYRKMAALIQTVYIELARKRSSASDFARNSGEYLERFRTFEHLLENHFLVEKSPVFYAGQLGISERHLHRIVKQISGKNPRQLITDRLILEAKRLLGSGQFRPSEVAHFLGFDEYAYFSRVFTQHVGMNPRAFKLSYD